MMRTFLFLVSILVSGSLPFASALAEPLPGLLSPQAIEEARAEAKQQKKDAQQMVRRHAKKLGYSKEQIAQALKPTMIRSGSFTMTLGDGTMVKFPWYRIGFAENDIANTSKLVARNPQGAALRQETNKGGLRLHHGVFASEVYALALKMDTKLATAGDAIAGHSFRGAKGGIGAGRIIKVGSRYQARVGDHVDPASPLFDRKEIMEKFAHSYLAKGGRVGPGLDIQAGDVNTKAAEMKVLAETYGSPARPSPGISGKAVMRQADGSIDPRGGIEYRGISTGEGVWMGARQAARKEGLTLRGATVVAQGWGEVGRAFGLAAMKDGARVIAIQEMWNVGGKKVVGMLHCPASPSQPKQIRKWLADVDALRQSNQDLTSFQGGRLAKHFVPQEDASQVRADIVGVNALGSVLNEKTVPQYVASGTHQGKRKVITEGANLAETSEGARLLDKHQNTLLTIAGDLANLGGVHVSNLEAVQNRYGKAVTSVKARRSLQGTIRAGWNRALKLSQQHGLTERQAIELAAVDGMMKRSLQLPKAPRSNLERQVQASPRLPRRAPALRMSVRTSAR